VVTDVLVMNRVAAIIVGCMLLTVKIKDPVVVDVRVFYGRLVSVTMGVHAEKFIV